MRTRLTLIALIVATLVAYAPVRYAGLVYEDGVYMSFAQRPLTFEDLAQPRGLTALSFRVQGVLGAVGPQPYHAVNVACHLLVGLIFFGLARTLLPVPYALVAVGLYFLHPINTEAVAYIAGRAELIAAMGTVAAVWALAGPATWMAAGLAFLATVIAIGGKETGLMALGLIGLYAVVIRRVPVLRTWRGAGWALGGLATFVVLALPILQTRILGAIEYLLMTERTPVRYALTQAYAVVVLLGNALWPSGLTVDHDYEFLTRGWALVCLGLLAAGLVAAWWIRRRAPVVTFGIGWVAIALLPRFVVPQSEHLNEPQIVTAFLGLWLASAAGLMHLNAFVTAAPKEAVWDAVSPPPVSSSP